jgi:hypothetical protein
MESALAAPSGLGRGTQCFVSFVSLVYTIRFVRISHFSEEADRELRIEDLGLVNEAGRLAPPISGFAPGTGWVTMARSTFIWTYADLRICLSEVQGGFQFPVQAAES